MPSIQEIHKLVTELQEKKLLNLDAPAKDILSLQSVVLRGNDPSKYGWYVLGGEHYVVVCGLEGRKDAINPAAVNPVKY
jgi:hypothetical protein